MYHATFAAPTLTTFPISTPSLRLIPTPRIIIDAAVAALQSAILAALLWLILAGPGLLSDTTSTVPLHY